MGVTFTSLIYSTYVDNDPSRQGAKKLKETFDAKHYQKVTNFVTDMYSGNGVIETHELRLASTSTFEDPAAICCTSKEIKEAFRALEVAQPNCLSKPICISVQPNGESIELTYHLNQLYGNFLNVRSLLVINFRLARMNGGEMPENYFEVTKLEERWNGTEPLGFLPFWISRRINGLISWNLTRLLIGEKKV